MNDLDKTQRIVIAGAVAVGVISVALTLSGAWPLPSALTWRGFMSAPSGNPNTPQSGTSLKYPTSTASTFEELLKNGTPSESASEEVYLNALGGSLPQLFELEQKSLSQAEGDKLQEKIIQETIGKIIDKSSSTLDVPEPHITITKDTSRASKQAHLAQLEALKNPLEVIAAFFNDTSAISSKENLSRTAPAVLAAYDTVLAQGAAIPVPQDWAPLYLAAMHALAKQRVGLQALYFLENDPAAAVKGMRTLNDGALEYIAASKASLAQLRKEGF